MFCPKCGFEVSDSSKFCNECGAKLIQDNKEEPTFFTECPSCGANLKSFEAVCPSCGKELRHVNANGSVKRLEEMLYEIESKRVPQKPLGLFETHAEYDDPIDKQKASCIEAFAIPNTKEDIIELMILAASNINVSNINGLISNAWYSKFEQVYQKARLALANDPQLPVLKEMYEKKQQEIEDASAETIKVAKKILIGSVIFIIAMILLFKLI